MAERANGREEAAQPASAKTAQDTPPPDAVPSAAAQASGLPESGPLEPEATTYDHAVRLAGLLEAVEDAERVLILTHDNPDPDALASAAALAFLLERAAGVQVAIAFGGIVGRSENRALMEELGREFQRVDTLDEPASTLVALVDTQPRTGNNSLPSGRIASVVVDHHPLRPETAVCTFADVRPEYGSTSSIMVEYLRAADLEPDRKLATALFYGVQSETLDLGREASPADVSASIYLYPRSDPAAISRIRHARVPAGYFRSIHKAIAKARRHRNVVVVELGLLDYPDMVAEVADLFMHLGGVQWTIAMGRFEDKLLLSLRTYDLEAHAGGLVRSVMGSRGSAGGHGSLAGGQVDLRSLSEEEVRELRRAILRDLLEALEVEDGRGEPLIAAGPAVAAAEPTERKRSADEAPGGEPRE